LVVINLGEHVLVAYVEDIFLKTSKPDAWSEPNARSPFQHSYYQILLNQLYNVCLSVG